MLDKQQSEINNKRQTYLLVKNPKKRDFRQHAHVNPYKQNEKFIPDDFVRPAADFVDIGCGYGKFLIRLGLKYPEKIIYGMEIREKVKEFVAKKILFLRQNPTESNLLEYRINSSNQIIENSKQILKNIDIFSTNAMLFFPHFFNKRSLEKIFILFPDPHFKKRKQKVRMVTRVTVPYFEYVLKENGRIYISTDVEDLFIEMVKDMEWMFDRLNQEESEKDPLFMMIGRDTDESTRAGARVEKIHRGIFIKKN
ncbi:tRNA Methyltransferase-like protein [Pseudoloma neurophilia]|uniref:tRNA (guanine-N(7)-)-methyltransferase n=1 Tax=Pseudoloma neurophilia TaxID=146866 RepID=A0A0R0M0E2_9MICR|nr:tRNA Methyltransferase-like protein [Pseudoloma neurophilia]